MSVWDNTPATLTSFTPLSSEVQTSGNFLSRIFKRGKDDSDQSSGDGSKASSREVSMERGTSRDPSVDRSLNLREQSLEQSQHMPERSSSGEIERPVSQQSGEGAGNSTEPGSSSGEIKSYQADASKRTLSSVITRLSAILERRTATPQVYRDSDFKQYWMPDSSCRECYDCGDKFTTFRRRHHCRICGQIFCNACCSQELPGKIIGYKGSIRVCTYCYQIVQKYAQKADPSGDPKVTKEVLHRYLESDGALSPEQGVKGQKRSVLDQLLLRSPGELDNNQDGIAPFDLTPQSEFVVMDNFSSERRLLIQDSMQLRNLWSLILDTDKGVEFQNYRIRLRTYQKCIAGNRLVDWLLNQDKVANRVQAVAIGQALIDADYLDPIHTVTTPFRDDFTLYKPTDMPLTDPVPLDFNKTVDSLSEDSAPQWFQDIQSNNQDSGGGADDSTCQQGGSVTENTLTQSSSSASYSELSQDSSGKIKVDERHFDEPFPRENLLGAEDVPEPMFGNVVAETDKAINDNSATSTWKTLDIASEDSVEKEAFERLQREHHEHLTVLTNQLLSEENLHAGWADIIISTVDRVSLFVRPDVKNKDDMDIRRYVHIKKIPGGKKEQTGLLHGVIFKKNIAHKKMSQQISNPAVLLLNGSIEYQRVENKLSSFQPQILQEEEFLHKSIAKIAALKPKPDVVVVEKSVSRLAQNFLLKKGITLVYNVKLSVMERLARFLNTEIATSVDGFVSGVKPGFCHTFSVRNFSLPSGETKTLIYMDGCATHLGCAITLRGGSTMELKRVKKIMHFMIYASYHSRLEISFCMDEFLMPPLKHQIDLDLDQNQTEITGVKDSQRGENGRKGKTDVPHPDSFVRTSEAADVKTELNNVEPEIKTSEIWDKEDTEGLVQPSVAQKEESAITGVAEKEFENIDSDSNNGNGLAVNNVLGIDELSPQERTIEDEIKTKTEDSLSGGQHVAINEETEGNRSNRLPSKIKTERTSSFIWVDETVEDIFDNGSDGAKKLTMDTECVQPEDKIQTLNELDSNIPNVCDINQTSTNTVENDISDLKTVQDILSLSDSICDTPINQTEDTDNSDKTQKVKMGPKLTPNMLDPDGAVTKPESTVVRQRNRSWQNSDRSPSARRKIESTQLTDKSDPLHNYQICQDDSIFQSSLALEEQLHPHRFKFRKALENVALSTSPYIKYDLPYLETEVGSKCELRRYFPEEIYWSSHMSSKSVPPKWKPRYEEMESVKKFEPPSNICITEAHEFIRSQLNLPYYDRATQYMLAKFRAYGGRINILESVKTVKSEQKSSKIRENQSNKGKQSDGTKGDDSVREYGMFWEKKQDCLDPFKHQRIAVLFSSFSYESENHPNPCVYPWVVTMEFYGRNDITLGGFLKRFCFRESYVCPSDSCSTSMEKHIRRFVHGQGSISVILKKLEQPMVNGQNSIHIWSWCHKCKQVTPVVPMSTDTWNMSFAKYLEIRFHGTNFQRRASAEKCMHSLHHEHFQYFGSCDTVASFKYSPIKVKEIKLPPLVISCKPMIETIQLYRLKDEVKRLTQKMTDLYSLILDCMTKMKADSLCDNLARVITDCISLQQTEKTRMRELAHKIREKLNTLLKQEEDKKVFIMTTEQKRLYGAVEDDIVILKKEIAECVNSWNSKLQELYVQQKKTKQNSNQKKEKDKDTVSIAGSVTMETDEKDSKSLPVSVSKSMETDFLISSPLTQSEDAVFSMSDMDLSESHRKSDCGFHNTPPPIRAAPSATSIDSYIYGVTPGITAAGVFPGSMHTGFSESYVVCHRTPDTPIIVENSTDDLEAFVDSLDSDGQFIPIATNLPEKELEIISNVKENPEEPPGGEKINIPDNVIVRKSPAEVEVADTQAADKIGAIKKTLMNTIWQGSGAYQLQMPFDPFEHYLLPPCDRLPVVVYDHEPSSIIAYSLSSHDYHTKLHEIQVTLSQGQRTSKAESEITDKSTKEETTGLARRTSYAKLSFFKGGGKDRQDQPDTVRYVNKQDSMSLESPQDETDYSVFTASTAEAVDKSKSGKQVSNQHIELQFADSTARFYCKVYFAEQFRHLRKLIFPDGEEMFIRSISRCKPWEAKGGKSGSAFCKTDDDRFILKQMSSMEVESFEKFGSHYFQYISKSELQQRPTALAKIVGVYRIGFRNQHTNNAMKQDLLVMENLFYNRNISQTFDLKGSVRNRLVKATCKRDEELVLLDENFLKVSVDCPLYILSHSKTMLMCAIGHDSQFLSSNLIMDYSLLVGVDEQKKELVVGIIDYIRTFTWDKKLETIFKSNFGGQGKLPTVVSPELYRTRFQDAMAKYFLSVPDQWSGLGRDVDG